MINGKNVGFLAFMIIALLLLFVSVGLCIMWFGWYVVVPVVLFCVAIVVYESKKLRSE